MKFVHLSDLHLGKRVNEFSMLEDQKHILGEILKAVRRLEPDAVLIAGDVYDKSVPSAEAVRLFDSFLTGLHAIRPKTPQIFIISGNHDSAERIAFGAELMSGGGVHLSPVYDGRVEPVTLTDEYGPVNLYLLPFVKPVHVRQACIRHDIPGWEDIQTYNDAIRKAVELMEVDPAQRNLLMTHQFVTGSQRCDSEELSVGGTDNVDADNFADFDYVALGHIHGPQNAAGPCVRYCGSPLKYSFSEANHKKSLTVVDFGPKGQVSVTTEPLVPFRDMRELRGPFEALSQTPRTEDYVHVTLTDEEDVPNVMAKLRVPFPNLMKLDYDNRRTRNTAHLEGIAEERRQDPLEVFGEFYRITNDRPMSEEQETFLRELIETIWEGSDT